MSFESKIARSAVAITTLVGTLLLAGCKDRPLADEHFTHMAIQEKPFPSNEETDAVVFPVEARDMEGATRHLVFTADCDKDSNVSITEQTLDGVYVAGWAKSYNICEDGSINALEADIVFKGIQDFFAPSK